MLRRAMVVSAMNGPADDQRAANGQFTIRFPQVDAAGIVFYPRYFEMVTSTFPWLPLEEPPFRIETRFLRPNRLGDRLELQCVSTANSVAWSVTGQLRGETCFSMVSSGIESLPDDIVPDEVFETAEQPIGEWSVGSGGRLSLSRSFELVNVAIEEWFEDTLGLAFHELHVGRKVGIPTAQFVTHVRELPDAGTPVSIRIRPTRVGRSSTTFVSWIITDGRWLIRNEQVIVFVRMLEAGYELMPIPDEIRQRFVRQLGAGA